jgi:hypothetical protein
MFLPLGILCSIPALPLLLMGFTFRAAGDKESKREGEEYLQISAWLGGAAVFCFAVTLALILLKVRPNPCMVPETDRDEEGEELIPLHKQNPSGENEVFREAGVGLLKASQL